MPRCPAAHPAAYRVPIIARAHAERSAVERLRYENRQLTVERGIPGKAAASFAREAGTIPPEPSSSGARARLWPQ